MRSHRAPSGGPPAGPHSTGLPQNTSKKDHDARRLLLWLCQLPEKPSSPGRGDVRGLTFPLVYCTLQRDCHTIPSAFRIHSKRSQTTTMQQMPLHSSHLGPRPRHQRKPGCPSIEDCFGYFCCVMCLRHQPKTILLDTLDVAFADQASNVSFYPSFGFDVGIALELGTSDIASSDHCGSFGGDTSILNSRLDACRRARQALSRQSYL